MVTLSSAENALKTVCLGVVADQLNINANPLLGKIQQTTKDVWGKEIRKLAPYGINGGIGAGDEDGQLPSAAANNYVQYVSTLKNLFGTIDISDKAIRASANNAGAFINLLNAEMEGLIKASSFNLGRMLYGDGSGLLATISSVTGGITVDSVKNLMEGMVVDAYSSGTAVASFQGARILTINRTTKVVTFSKATTNLAVNDTLYIQGSKGKEITGLGSIFGNGDTLYGVTKANHPWMNPYVNSTADNEISDNLIQTAVDFLDEVSGSAVDFISCSAAVKRAYQQYLGSYRRNVDVVELQGGYKALTFNGIPFTSDRFVADDTLYLLNTKDFVLHQLCDWQWLEGDDGKVIKQKQGYPTYTATLVKYADLICNKPNGQAKITNISSTVENPFKPTVNVTVEAAATEGSGT